MIRRLWWLNEPQSISSLKSEYVQKIIHPSIHPFCFWTRFIRSVTLQRNRKNRYGMKWATLATLEFGWLAEKGRINIVPALDDNHHIHHDVYLLYSTYIHKFVRVDPFSHFLNLITTMWEISPGCSVLESTLIKSRIDLDFGLVRHKKRHRDVGRSKAHFWAWWLRMMMTM